MALYLVQHGKSLPKEIDPERGLSEEGISDVRRIADIAKTYKVPVSCIKHSGKKRARQTAEIFAFELAPKGGMEAVAGLSPSADVIGFASMLNSRNDLMFIGHLPFMERLTSYLITGSIEKTVIQFQNGGIVCLNRAPGTGLWVIKWTLMPKIS